MWALNQNWALINFFCLKDGCLFVVGVNSRLGTYLYKYGTLLNTCLQKLCQAVHWMLKISKGLPSTMNIWEFLKIQILLIIKTKLSGNWILTSLEEISKMRFSVVLSFPHINFLLAALDNNR